MIKSSATSDVSWSTRFGGAALITGASSGIGKAFAWALAARGMDLVLVALEDDLLVELAAEIKAKYGVRAVGIATNLSQPDCAELIRNRVEVAGLTVGLLVNNAGFGLFGPFTELDLADQAAMVDVNCRAPLALARVFAPDMKARGRGGIIFTASTAAYQPTPCMATYAATKAFDLFLAEALWAELEEHGVEVLALSPGHCKTNFQARCGDPIHKPPGGEHTPEQIVEVALGALGQRPSVIPGLRNVVMSRLTRLLPRRSVMRNAIGYFDHQVSKRPVAKAAMEAQHRRSAAGDGRAARASHGRFVRTVLRLLVAFFAVAFIDVVVCSLITHKLRFWFPLWLEPDWETNPSAWVVYSQSYAAGIVFLPVLISAAVREFVPKTAHTARKLILGGTLAVFAFILWWKGGLMLQHHKGQEAIAWVILTGAVWGLLQIGEALPGLAARITPRQLAFGMARVLSVFFLVMAVLDPVVTVGVQGLPWTSGLFIEMGFFIPAGLALLYLTTRRRSEAAEGLPLPIVPQSALEPALGVETPAGSVPAGSALASTATATRIDGAAATAETVVVSTKGSATTETAPLVEPDRRPRPR